MEYRTIYVPVKTEDRLPETSGNYICTDGDSESNRYYYFYSDIGKFLDKYGKVVDSSLVQEWLEVQIIDSDDLQLEVLKSSLAKEPREKVINLISKLVESMGLLPTKFEISNRSFEYLIGIDDEVIEDDPFAAVDEAYTAGVNDTMDLILNKKNEFRYRYKEV